MKRRTVLRNLAAGSGIAFGSSTATADEGSRQRTSPEEALDVTVLDGPDENRVLRDAWQDLRETRIGIQQTYDFSFSRNDGGAKRLRDSEGGNELVMAAFHAGFDSVGRNADDSRHALLVWRRRNGTVEDPYGVVEGMAADFETSPDAVRTDPDFQAALDDLDVTRDAALRHHVSMLRIHEGTSTKVGVTVHETRGTAGMFTDSAIDRDDSEHPTTEASSITYQYIEGFDQSLSPGNSAGGVGAASHGGGGLADCIKDAPGIVSLSCFIGSCLQAVGSTASGNPIYAIASAAACAACGCWAGCWVGACSKHVGNTFCQVQSLGCIITLTGVPTGGSCCVVFGCHFDCAWIN